MGYSITYTHYTGVPVKDPVGNWQEVTVGNTCGRQNVMAMMITMMTMMMAMMTTMMTMHMIDCDDDDDDDDDDYLTSRAHQIGTYSWLQI